MYEFGDDTNLDSQSVDLEVPPSSEDTGAVPSSEDTGVVVEPPAVQDSTAHLPPPTSISKER